MKRLIVSLALLATVGGAGPATAGTLERAPRYLPSVVDDGMAFPVARSNWYSVINFHNDWHAPRMRKIDGKWRQVGLHEGNDIFAEPGTPIRAVLGGTVERTGWTFYSGWRIGVRGDDGRYWFYAHMMSYDPSAVTGARVEAGDPLGVVGNTGYGEDPGHKDEFIHHLHLGIQEPDGTWVNPYPVMRSLYRAAVKAER